MSSETLAYLGLGIVAVLPLIWYAEKLSNKGKIKLLGRTLVVAAVIYPLMALFQGQTQYLPIELAGIVLYGGFYWLALRFNPIFLAIGWAAHTGWDALLHLNGPIQHVAPDWYAYACLSFDLVVAGYLLLKR